MFNIIIETLSKQSSLKPFLLTERYYNIPRGAFC